jgi:glycerol-3-phosphate dehydrogenase
MRRDPRALASREHDLLVIGGGIAGAWVLFEAASRGIAAALVEIEDFGQATSWSSLKTAHGGLRHLQRLDLAGFRESVRERRALLRVAPEIVRPLPFAIQAGGWAESIKFALGGLANDLLSLDRNEGLRADRFVARSRLMDAGAATALGAPGLSAGRVFMWHDAQITHTERLLVGLLHAATGAGAVAINRCRIESCRRAGGVYEVTARDLVDGTSHAVRARAVINAAGAALEDVARLFGDTCGSPPLIRGVNVVLDRELCPSMAMGARDQGRFLFVAPWLGRSILGTTYDDGRREVGDLVSDLMAAGRRALPWANLREENISAIHEGHVPGAPDGEPVYRSRLIAHADPRLLSILTAKYTTARATAEAAINRLAPAFSTRPGPSVSAVSVLPKAVPMAGSLSERIAQALDEEMALSRADAMRGRLIEGAFGRN